MPLRRPWPRTRPESVAVLAHGKPIPFDGSGFWAAWRSGI